MKKILISFLVSVFFALVLTGCNTVGNKTAKVSSIYTIAALLSLLLLLVCIILVRKKRIWFITLFTSVFVVNIGYTFLSVSNNLQTALWANRLSYLGSVFLPTTMLMIILNVTNTSYKKWLPYALLMVASLVFLIAASPGILPIYYKDVSFNMSDGVSTLVKVYGPLHPIYLFYLLGYFTAMVTIIIRAKIKKTIDITAYAIILAIAVFVNIGVWFIEQIVVIDFEMLSLSYIISELFLLGIHLVMNENQRLKEIVKQVELIVNYSENDKISTNAMLEEPIKVETISTELIKLFINGLNSLTPTEKAIYEAHIARFTSKEIMSRLNIKESTLKYHNRNLYGKLGVSTRKELLEVHKYIKSVNAKLSEESKSFCN